MAKNNMTYPIAIKISPHEGHYLTELDWQSADVSALCYDLETVIFQSQQTPPGWENIPVMIHPWHRSVIIDLRRLSFKKTTMILQSPFNGQKYRIEWTSWLRKAIEQCDYFWLFPKLTQLPQAAGDWISFLPQTNILQAGTLSELPTYWQSLGERQTCLAQTPDHLQTWLLADQICEQTAAGMVLDDAGPFQIADEKWRKSTAPLAAHCLCEACVMGFQRCYFHHLHRHVPLLANRYLTLHNLCQMKFYA